MLENNCVMIISSHNADSEQLLSSLLSTVPRGEQQRNSII